jgi:hypothetical protein
VTEHRPLVRTEPLEAGREQRVDPGWYLDRCDVADGLPPVVPLLEDAVVDQHRDHLLDEQGIALGRLGDPIPEIERRLDLAQQERDQSIACGLVQGIQLHEPAPGNLRPPLRTPLEEIGTGDAQEEERYGRRHAPHVLQQREEGRLGPVRVVDHRDHGARSREPREEDPDRPEPLLHGGVRLEQACQPCDRVGDRASVVIRPEQRFELLHGDRGGVFFGDARGLFHHLRERPERDAVPVGETSPGQDRRPVAGASHELLGQPRLAYPGSADHRHHPAPTLGDRAFERPLQLGERVLAPDQRRHQTRRVIAPVGDRHEPIRPERFRLALDRHGRDRCDRDRSAEQAVGRVRDDDVAGRRGLLQPGGRVRGVADHQTSIGREDGPRDQTGVDAGPGREDHAVPLLEPVVEGSEGLAHLQRGARGPERVVFVELGEPEHGHHGVADELGERASVTSEDRLDGLEVLRHDVGQRLGIQALAESRRVHEVGEQDGHHPTEALG